MLGMSAPTAFGTALLRWIELALPDPPWPEPDPFVGFVFLDAEAGLSTKGGRAGDPSLAERPTLTVRLPIGVPSRLLTADEVRDRNLPAIPAWLAAHGPQPAADGPWRGDRALRGRFHPQFPDDLQVLIHDGDPRRTGARPELAWVRVHEAVAGRSGTYRGELRSAPRALATVRKGDSLGFLASPGGRYPLLVTAPYLAERAAWRITPCDGCGLGELFDPPSTALASATREADGRWRTACGACRGHLFLESIAERP